MRTPRHPSRWTTRAWSRWPATLEITRLRSEDGTAIGDALGLAVERLRESPAASRIAVLLTDGVNNAGIESPPSAAELAHSQGVKVYTIGAGSTGIAPVRDQRGVLRSVPVQIDEATLRNIADRTGGRYFRADNAQALVEVYAEIDRLERTRITEERSRQYEELFAVPLLAGLLLMVLGWLGRSAVFFPGTVGCDDGVGCLEFQGATPTGARDGTSPSPTGLRGNVDRCSAP